MTTHPNPEQPVVEAARQYALDGMRDAGRYSRFGPDDARIMLTHGFLSGALWQQDQTKALLERRAESGEKPDESSS